MRSVIDGMARIAIDARYAEGPTSGIGRYIQNLLAGIADLSPGRRVAVFITNRTVLPPAVTASPAFQWIPSPGRPKNPADQWIMAKSLAAHGIDLLHSPDVFAPLFWRGKTLLTVHDLIPLVCRKLLHSGMKSRFAALWSAWLRLQCARAAAILTVSRQSATDLRSILNIDTRKIHLVSNGVAGLGLPGKDEAEVLRQRYGLTGKILLYVGRRDPTKNLALLVRAFSGLPLLGDGDVKLVIAGSPDRRYREAECEAEKCGISSRVVYTGYLKDSELAALYGEADAFAFPSVYEGFGLPPLEAMQHGTPVIASDIPVFSEVLGDGALLVSANSVDAWTEAIHRVLTDASLAQSLVARGLERVKKFTVSAQAAGTLEIYDRVLA